MREHKYRAWDHAEGRYYSVGVIDFANKKVQLAIIEKEICYFEKWIHFDSIDLEEYTGLKDKNGKEIYEADIVRCSSTNQFAREVIFEDGEYWFLTPKPHAIAIPIIAVKTSHPDTEVIGNIHENPELLTT